MKRKLLILSVLAICLSTLAAGTLAYFTAEDKALKLCTVEPGMEDGAYIR